MSSGEKLVEQVARAINPKAWEGHNWYDDDEAEAARQTAYRRARAVIPIVLQHAAEVAESMILYSGQDIADAILALSDQDSEV